MRDVLRQDSLKMTPTEDEEPVEALPADAADEALGKRVRARRPNGRLDDPVGSDYSHIRLDQLGRARRRNG